MRIARSTLTALTPHRREEIGVLTSLPLLRNVVGDLERARNNEECSLTLYFTKESHIHTLVNLVLLSGLPIANRRIPELDYCVSIRRPHPSPCAHLTTSPCAAARRPIDIGR